MKGKSVEETLLVEFPFLSPSPGSGARTSLGRNQVRRRFAPGGLLLKVYEEEAELQSHNKINQ